MASIASLVISLGADIADFQTDMQRASGISKRELAKMQAQADKLNKEWNTAFKAAGLAVAAGLGLAIKSAADFEKAMAEASTLLNDTSGLNRTEKAVKDLAVQFGQAPVDQAKALYQIISAGASDAATQVEILTASNKLAVGGVTDVATAADGLTSVLNAYAGTGLDSAKASDILFTTMKQGKTTIGELSSSLGKVVTIAAQTGVSFEEIGASIGTITKAGIGTAEAVSALRGVLAAVLKPTTDAVKVANELGVSFDTAALKSKGLSGFLADIANSGATDAQLSKLFGQVEGLTAVMALGANSAKEFNAQLDAQAKAAGATEEAVGKMMESTAFKADQARAAFQVLTIEIGQRFLSAVSGALTAFVEHIERVQIAVESLAAVVVARAGVAIVASFTAAAAAGKTLATVMAFVGGPVGLLASGVALLVVNWDNLIARTDGVGEFARLLTRGFTILLGVLKAVAVEMINLGQIAVNLVQIIGAPITALAQQWAAAVEAIQKGDILGAVTGVGLLAKKSGQEAAAAFENLKNNIMEVGDSSKYMFEAWDEANRMFTNTDADEKIRQLEDAAQGFLKAASDARNRANEFAKSLLGVGTASKSGEKDIKALEKAAAMFLRVASSNKRALQDHIDALEESARKQIAYNKSIQDFIDIGDPVGAMVREFERKLKFANEALAKGDITAQQYQASLNNLTDALGKAAAGLQTVAEENDLMKEAMLESVRILERSFADMWESILSGGDGVFDGLKDGFIAMISKMQHEASTRKIVLQIENAINGKAVDFKQLGEGFAALASQIIGAKLGGGGENANIGAALGGLAGSIAGPIGSAIGSILGGVIGGLFDSSRPSVLDVSGYSRAGLSTSDTDAQVRTAFGDTFLRSRRLDASAIQEFSESLKAFDKAIAGFLDEDQIAPITDALKSWQIQIQGESFTTEQILKSRFSAILGTFDQQIQMFAKKGEELAEQVERLGIGITVEKLFKESPDLFTSRTVSEFLAVVEAFQDGTETITDAFNEVLTILNSVVSVTKSLKDFAASDLGADFAEQMALAGRSLTQVLADMGSDLFDAIAGFDGTPQSLAAIGDMVQSIRLKEMELLAQIDAITNGINTNLEALRAKVLGLTEGPKTGADFFNAARDLVQQVLNAGSIEDVAALERQFSSLIGSISPEDQIAMQGPILQLIDSFQAAANDVMGDFRADALESAQSMRDLVDVFLVDIADPLALIAASNDRAAAALELISGQEQGFADPMDTADETPGLIDRIIAANGTASQDQNRILEDGMQELSRVMADGGDYMAAAVVNAIRQVQIRNSIVVRESDLVTR